MSVALANARALPLFPIEKGRLSKTNQLPAGCILRNPEEDPMKKKTKKLVLAKETVRSLEHSALQRIAGATDYSVSCEWYCLGTWASCAGWCN